MQDNPLLTLAKTVSCTHLRPLVRRLGTEAECGQTAALHRCAIRNSGSGDSAVGSLGYL